MPYIPHTQEDINEMLEAIGVSSIETLFDEIPVPLRTRAPLDVPEGMNDMQTERLMRERAKLNKMPRCFIGAGAYQHHIPAAVWDLAMRGELLTAYTPYQAEASQGTLQIIFEFQTMMARLLGMDVANASLYDGATAVAEALLMAVRANKQSKSQKILVPETLHPFYWATLETLVKPQQIELTQLPMKEGRVDKGALAQFEGQDITALVINQPNFFGQLEAVDELTDWAHAQNAFAIGVVNPIAMALLKPPGEWGKKGVDIACGEGQPLGVPLASGGPYFGFFTCRKKYVRQLPGRLVGQTVDASGNTAYALTLQTREQHIRRAKATSNICTNQGLLVTAATIYMSLLGYAGLKKVAASSYHLTAFLREQLNSIETIEIVFPNNFFHEIVIQLPKPAEDVIEAMEARGFAAGLALEPFYPQLKNTLLVCATETKTEDDCTDYVRALVTCLG